MIIIQGVNDYALPRLAVPSLMERLAVMPVVVVTGARQTGKSTLVQELIPGNRRFFSLDDLDALDLARRNPGELLAGAGLITIDEVQKAPDLLQEVKRAVDRDLRPGRFLLTGSANLSLMRQISESLAGRASYLTLWPMTHREQQGAGRGGIWEELLQSDSEHWPDLLAAEPDNPQDWRQLARRGGFPHPALRLDVASERELELDQFQMAGGFHQPVLGTASGRELELDQFQMAEGFRQPVLGVASERDIWFDGYVRTYLERDLSDISSVSALPDFRRLMRMTCLRIGQLVNQTALGRDAALSQPTVRRYLNLLETSYMLVRIPAYAVNRTKRLIKSPKLYWADTGLALFLAGGQPQGAHLENIVLNSLLAWRDARPGPVDIFYWRTASGEEVDFVIEAGDDLLPVEVKSSPRPRLRDGEHIRTFRSEYGEDARAGLVLHGGREVKWLTPNVLAAPWWKVL